MHKPNHETMKQKTAEVARDVQAQDPKAQKGNGNNYELEETKTGNAQKGGPGIEKASERQPPDAVRAR